MHATAPEPESVQCDGPKGDGPKGRSYSSPVITLHSHRSLVSSGADVAPSSLCQALILPFDANVFSKKALYHAANMAQSFDSSSAASSRPSYACSSTHILVCLVPLTRSGITLHHIVQKRCGNKVQAHKTLIESSPGIDQFSFRRYTCVKRGHSSSTPPG